LAFDPRGENFSAPTAADASRILDEITPVSRRSRQLARDVTFARPLLAWGLAWMAGATLYEFIPGRAGALLGTAACAAALAVTWLVRPREVRLDNERRFGALWFVFLAVSPLLIAVVQPPDGHVMTVLLGSLWAVGMLLYGIGVRDISLAALGLAIVMLAAATRVAAPGAALLAVGLAGGLGMAALGGWRMRWKR
jgi:hypothetical protein